MNKKLRKTIIILRISAIAYFLIGLLLFAVLNVNIFVKIIFLLVALICGIFIEFIIRGLKNNKFWAWVAGVIICSIYLPSGFIILGIIGLMGLFNKEVISGFFKT